LLIEFETGHVTFKSKDHTKQTAISVTIDGSRIGAYYCEAPFTVCVDTDCLYKALSTVTSGHTIITMFSNKDNYRSCIEVILVNPEASIQDNFDINLSLVSDTNDFAIPDEKSNYVLKTTMNSKSLKKYIIDTSSSKILTIEKIGESLLKFKTSYNHKIEYIRTFLKEDGVIFDERSTPFLNVNLKLECVRPFCKMNLGKTVNICIAETHAMFERVLNNGAITVRIYTKPFNRV
jgi:hypothetical protein